MSTSTVNQPPAPASRVFTVVAWILRILTAGIFLFFGVRRLIASPAEGGTFDQLGFGDWFRYLIGILEVLGAIGLLLPMFAGLAAVCLAALMVGAASVELFVVDSGGAGGPLLCLGLSLAIALLMRRRILEPVAYARRLLSAR